MEIINPFTNELVNICEIKLAKGNLNRTKYLNTRVDCSKCGKNLSLKSFYDVSNDTMHNKCKICRNREIKKLKTSAILELLSSNTKINDLIEKL